MKNTVKLEQFVALKEKDLQKIKGGEIWIYLDLGRLLFIF
ncbi:competence-stimulating peptide ComC [Streptococcus pneumoniae]|nr:competence-stimulating peptide ComC [Streptococcus pneumoniae]MDS5882569.1 competence-stimulating peptide ComC [Streptococcus pneumoniae]MDT5981795.1 competence-stimulating peptide ComC [Streptococcus pneumoniae]